MNVRFEDMFGVDKMSSDNRICVGSRYECSNIHSLINIIENLNEPGNEQLRLWLQSFQ